MLVGPGLVIFGLAACDLPPPEFGDVLPGQELILREDELIARGFPEDPSPWATWLLDEARAANRRHTELVLLVEAVTLLPANYRDRGSELAVAWGPWIVDDTAERLWVEDAGTEGYEWAIDRQTVDPDRVRFDDDAWIEDLTGSIQVADDEPIGGEFVLDVDEVGFGPVDDALEAFGDGSSTEPYEDDVDEVVDEEPIGRVGLRYTTQPDGTIFTTFPELTGSTVPSSGGVTFAPRSEGGVATATLDPARDDVPEPLEVTVQWASSGGGRADVRSVSTGATAVECWAPDHQVTFASGLGDEASCLFSALP